MRIMAIPEGFSYSPSPIARAGFFAGILH